MNQTAAGGGKVPGRVVTWVPGSSFGSRQPANFGIICRQLADMTKPKLKRCQNPDIPWPGREFYRGIWRTPEAVRRCKEREREREKEVNARTSEGRTEWREERQRRTIEKLNAAVQVEADGVATEDEQRVRWVWKHLFDVPMPKAPDKETATLLKLALLDYKGWADRYLAPILTKQRRDEADIEGERQDRDVEKLAVEWLNRRKFVPCPACGGEGAFNVRYLYTAASEQDLTDGGGI